MVELDLQKLLKYAASFYPTQLKLKEGYQQIIWTDASTHQYLEECGTTNVFFRVNDTLITAPTTDTILDGITGKSVIQIAVDGHQCRSWTGNYNRNHRGT